MLPTTARQVGSVWLQLHYSLPDTAWQRSMVLQKVN